MAELPDLEISKLPIIDTVDKDNDYLVISKESSAFASGYGSFKVTPAQLGAGGGGGGGGSAYTDIITTLEAGQTSVTVQSEAITATSIISIATNPWIPYISATSTTGEATITFDEQGSDVSVVVSIRSIS